MNDRCTAATAARLKAAGFPQPAPAPGQVWYGIDDDAPLIVTHGGQYKPGFVRENGLREVWTPPAEAWRAGIFAPGVADLLRALPHGLPLQYQNTRFRIAGHKNDNPAEVLAAAWLELNEKK